jgi:RNA polymerase sigma-54 factor
MIELDETATHILMEVIGNLNKDGYFCGTYEEVVQACNCTEAQVEEAMEELKSLDPPGIGARDLRECLLFQLEAHGRKDSLTYKVTSEHLGLLEKRKYDQIAKIESVAVEQVYAAITEIQSLDPRPASRFADDTIRYIIPDIYVYRDKNDYVVSLNEDGMPKLRVSPYYLDVLRNGDKDSSRAYLNERFKAASWLIKSIHQRQQTIYRVTQSIVKFQREFLDHGIHRLKPLVLKDVADDIEMHESTVSRVTTNKYVHTPQGVFELKFFFTTGISSGSGEVSSSAIKERIRQIIAAEPPKRPISDQAIVDALAEENVKIARRTVAKYRESLGILSSSKRKKLF